MKTLACFVLLVGLAASSTGQTSLRIAYRARPDVVRTLAGLGQIARWMRVAFLFPPL